MDDLIEPWLAAHPHLCAWMFVTLLLPVIHLYLRTGWLGKILGWRRGDGIWLMPPRSHWLTKLMVRCGLMKPQPPQRSRKSKPPEVSPL